MMKFKRSLVLVNFLIIILVLSTCQTKKVGIERHIELIGYWQIDQPGHALYEATIYEFKSDGKIRHVENYAFDENMQEFVGTVSKSDDPYCPPLNNCLPIVSCQFGDEWYSEDSTIINITGECSDGIQRNIKLKLLPPSLPSNRNYDVSILSVDGERDWFHGPFFWAWSKCNDLKDCLWWKD